MFKWPDLDGVSELRATIDGTQPNLKNQRVDREANPEGDAEELVRREMTEGARSEENAHHRPRSSDAEQNGNSA
jgi:hypothetical protein